MRIFVEANDQAGNQEVAEVLTSIHSPHPINGGDVTNEREMYGSLYLRELLTKQLSRSIGIVSLTGNIYHPLDVVPFRFGRHGIYPRLLSGPG